MKIADLSEEKLNYLVAKSLKYAGTGVATVNAKLKSDKVKT